MADAAMFSAGKTKGFKGTGVWAWIKAGEAADASAEALGRRRVPPSSDTTTAARKRRPPTEPGD